MFTKVRKLFLIPLILLMGCAAPAATPSAPVADATPNPSKGNVAVCAGSHTYTVDHLVSWEYKDGLWHLETETDDYFTSNKCTIWVHKS